MIEIKCKEFNWLKNMLFNKQIELRKPNFIKETIHTFDESDAVDAFKFFLESSRAMYDTSWDVAETPDALSVTIYNPSGGVLTTVKKWNTWSKDVKPTYRIQSLHPFNDKIETFNNKEEWEGRILEIEPNFNWRQAIPSMVYCGDTFIATIDYDL